MSSAAVLQCPHCGTEYTHQYCVEIFWRDKEDSDTGCHVVSYNNLEPQVTLNSDYMCESPSLRRDGLIIRFVCEACEKHSALTIAQHKGQTLVDVVRYI
jgi:hypothetical protein